MERSDLKPLYYSLMKKITAFHLRRLLFILGASRQPSAFPIWSRGIHRDSLFTV